MIMPLPTGEGRSRRRPPAWTYIPFVGVAALVYLIIGLISSTALTNVLIEATLFSGQPWMLTLTDLILILALFALFTELMKSLRIGGHSTVDHMLSMVVFVLCLVLFLLWGVAGTSGFLLITIMSLVDVMAGFAVSLATARRDISIGE
jgi:hypothetical protein